MDTSDKAVGKEGGNKDYLRNIVKYFSLVQNLDTMIIRYITHHICEYRVLDLFHSP